MTIYCQTETVAIIIAIIRQTLFKFNGNAKIQKEHETRKSVNVKNECGYQQSVLRKY